MVNLSGINGLRNRSTGEGLDRVWGPIPAERRDDEQQLWWTPSGMPDVRLPLQDRPSDPRYMDWDQWRRVNGAFNTEDVIDVLTWRIDAHGKAMFYTIVSPLRDGGNPAGVWLSVSQLVEVDTNGLLAQCLIRSHGALADRLFGVAELVAEELMVEDKTTGGEAASKGGEGTAEEAPAGSPTETIRDLLRLRDAGVKDLVAAYRAEREDNDTLREEYDKLRERVKQLEEVEGMGITLEKLEGVEASVKAETERSRGLQKETAVEMDKVEEARRINEEKMDRLEAEVAKLRAGLERV
ncbi:hypothetical protein P7C70_g9250, partial [Phenoliferia sp. Uapishka_3]